MGRKKKSKKKQQSVDGDVTINDCANADRIARERKTNIAHTVQRTEDVTWDSVDIGDYDFVQEEHAGETRYVLKKVSKNTETAKNDEGKDYPLDVWFLISEHIEPEHVSTFAAICGISYAVTRTAKFWYNMYNRYCSSQRRELPVRLRPPLRQYNLRAAVIRSLFHVYPPFVNRLKAVQRKMEHPDVLLKRLCVLMWTKQYKCDWIYSFKLVDSAYKRWIRSAAIDYSDLVIVNDEENCRMLQLTCKDYTPIPPLQGFYLTSAHVCLAPGFQHHRVKLFFQSSMNGLNARPAETADISIVFDSLISIKILDWWHPSYPHQSAMRRASTSEDEL